MCDVSFSLNTFSDGNLDNGYRIHKISQNSTHKIDISSKKISKKRYGSTPFEIQAPKLNTFKG